MGAIITGYNACCNLGTNIDEMYQLAITGCNKKFELLDILKTHTIRVGTINANLPNIFDETFNIRCNQLILQNLNFLKAEISALLQKYSTKDIAVIVATTNSGVAEYEKSHNMCHSELGNPALFVKEYLGLDNFYSTVSTACSSGIKAIGVARDLIDSDCAKAALVVGVDSIAKVPLYGFDALNLLTNKITNPFSQNITGINIGEGVATFIVEKNEGKNTKLQILGIGESSDIYHSTTPNPLAIEVKSAINEALEDAKLQPKDIDYINLHGTGTFANDLMESNAIFDIFSNKIPTSTTKPLTGHCLGASASIEIALCCKLIEKFSGKLYPNVFDNIYNEAFPKIKLVKQNDKYEKCNICMCNSFGFGGTNAIIIIGSKDE